MAVTFYCYPKCGTCKKARKWFAANDVIYNELHIVEQTPTADELKALIAMSGLEIKKFFNTSGQKYRDLQLKDKLTAMSDEEKLAILASDGMLIKRPLTTNGSVVTVGFKEDQFETVWK